MWLFFIYIYIRDRYLHQSFIAVQSPPICDCLWMEGWCQPVNQSLYQLTNSRTTKKKTNQIRKCYCILLVFPYFGVSLLLCQKVIKKICPPFFFFFLFLYMDRSVKVICNLDVSSVYTVIHHFSISRNRWMSYGFAN